MHHHLGFSSTTEKDSKKTIIMRNNNFCVICKAQLHLVCFQMLNNLHLQWFFVASCFIITRLRIYSNKCVVTYILSF